MSLKDQIANADDLYNETVEVPEWGITLTLRTPTVQERTRMIQQFVGPEGLMPTENLAEMYPALLIATCIDPETGSALFTKNDADLIRSKNGSVVERIATTAMRLCGLTDDAVPLPSVASSLMESDSTITT